MGISIDVDSIIIPKERYFYGPPNYEKYQREVVERICAVFGWPSTPWNEPSIQRGETATSSNASKYALLLNQARTHAHDSAMTETALYPQLLIHTESIVYYLPWVFNDIHFIESEWGTIALGSAPYFQAELLQLRPFIETSCLDLGTDAVIPNQIQTSHIWKAIYDLCNTLIEGAKESAAINLPLLLRG